MFPNFMSRYSQSGQGLIETLMIAVLLGFSALAFISFQSYLAYSTEVTHQAAEANLIAKANLETLRYFSVINTTSGYNAYQSIATSSQLTTVDNTTYTLSSTVTTTATPAYKNIQLTVSWTDRRGNAQTVVLVTNIAGLDPGSAGSFM
jgi:Tfp pilus assembly protein PilE